MGTAWSWDLGVMGAGNFGTELKGSRSGAWGSPLDRALAGLGGGEGVSAASVLLLDGRRKGRKFAAPLPVCLTRCPQACRVRVLRGV